MVKEEMQQEVRQKAREQAVERLLDLLLPPPPGHAGKTGFDSDPNGKLHYEQTREKFKQMLMDGRLDDREVDIDVTEKRPPMIDVVSGAGMEEMGNNLKDSPKHLFHRLLH